MIFKSSNQLNQAFPSKGRILALDVGTKRIGFALSDESRLIATPKLILNRQSNLKDFAKIKDFLNENQAVGIIVGRPTYYGDEEIAMTAFCEKFAANLDEFLEKKIPIFLFEERLSTFEAKDFHYSGISRNKGNNFVDDIAASVILQHFLDSFTQGGN